MFKHIISIIERSPAVGKRALLVLFLTLLVWSAVYVGCSFKRFSMSIEDANLLTDTNAFNMYTR